ncbi:MAG: L,D-transpeptidase [Candidatus Moranbacteria bacterium]|nr:L,D-transpeptidase [Candidatus Moranbacteria bacterium]
MLLVLTMVAAYVFSPSISNSATATGNDSSKQESKINNDESLLDELAPDGDEIQLSAVDVIEIGVESKQIRVLQNAGEGFVIKTYSAATASPKNTKGLPFDRKGHVTRIVFNPTWTPTENIQKENVAKTGKRLKKTFLPGEDNPLGKAKIFISYENGPNDLGIHDTNIQKSVGKRVSHGCNRMYTEDMIELASLILGQNDFDAEEIVRLAKENPKKTLVINIANGPDVYYRKK